MDVDCDVNQTYNLYEEFYLVFSFAPPSPPPPTPTPSFPCSTPIAISQPINKGVKGEKLV